MRGREFHIGQHVGFGLIHKRSQLWQPGAQLVGDLAHCALAAVASSWAKAVAMKAAAART